MKSLTLYAVIALSGMVFGAEIVASHVTQSLALLVSAYHMLYNILSLLLLVISHRMSKGKTLKNTFGWARVKVLGMLVNMLFLSALCFAAVVEAIQTMVHALHEHVEPHFPELVLSLGLLNLALNVLCFVLIGGYTHHQGCSMIIQGNEVQVNYVLAEANIGSDICMNAQNASTDEIDTNKAGTGPQVSGDHKLLDISRDISSCLAVITCACIVLLLDGLILKYADAILAISSVLILLATTYPFIRESGLILLQSIPNHMDVEGITNKLLKEFPVVQNVHDLHVWRLTTAEVIATVHIILFAPDIYTSIAASLSQFFEKEGISLVTIQPEFSKGTWSKQSTKCILQCSNNNCGALTCCGPLTESGEDGARQRNKTDRWSKTPCEGHHATCSTRNILYEPFVQSVQECDVPLLPQYDFGGIQAAEETKV